MAVFKNKEIYHQTLFCWILAVYIQMVHPQYCKEVYEEFVHCNSTRDFLITCPESHMIDIEFAYPMQLPKNQTCANDIQLTKGACRLESLGYYYSRLCSGQRTCLILADSWNNLEKVSCFDSYGDVKMLHMQYRCTLGTTSVSILNLCNVDITATSYVRLLSSAYYDMVPPTARAPTGRFYSSPCTCRMTLPGFSEMLISRKDFRKSRRGYNCDQRVVIESLAGEVVAVFCSSQKIDQFLACDKNWRDYVIRFETKDPSVNISFAIDFSVYHEVGFTFECGINLRTPGPPSLSSTSSSTTMSTTTAILSTTSMDTSTTTTGMSTTTESTTEATSSITSSASSTTETTTELMTTPSTPNILTTPTTQSTTLLSSSTPSTTEKLKPLPAKVKTTTESDSSSSDTTEVTTTPLQLVESTSVTTTKRPIAPIDENDVSNIVEASDVRVDNTRGVSQDDRDSKDTSTGKTDDNLLLPIEAIIGIAVGSVFFLVLLVIMASCFSRNKTDRSNTTEQVNLDLSFKDEPIYEEPKYYATSWDNPDLYPQGKKSFKSLPPGLPPRNSNLYAEPPSSTSSGSMRRSRFDDFRSRSLDFSMGTVSSAPYLSAKKIPLPSHPHVNQAFAPDPPLPMRTRSPPSRVLPPTPLQTATLPIERHFEMAPMSPMSPLLRGMSTTPAPSKSHGLSPKTKPKPTKLPMKRAMSSDRSDRQIHTVLPPRHYKHHIEPVFSATTPDRAKNHDKKRLFKRQRSASPPRVHFQHLPDVLPHGSDTVQNPIFGRDAHDMFFAY